MLFGDAASYINTTGGVTVRESGDGAVGRRQGRLRPGWVVVGGGTRGTTLSPGRGEEGATA